MTVTELKALLDQVPNPDNVKVYRHLWNNVVKECSVVESLDLLDLSNPTDQEGGKVYPGVHIR